MHSTMAASPSKPALAPVGYGGGRGRDEKEGGTPNSPSGDRGTVGTILQSAMACARIVSGQRNIYTPGANQSPNIAVLRFVAYVGYEDKTNSCGTLGDY